MSKSAVIVSSRREHRVRDEGANGILGVSDFTESRQNIWKALIAECLGTLILTFLGTSSCVDLGVGDSASFVRIAFTFGLVVATVVQAIAHVSGGHINPAVTVSFMLTGEVRIIKGICYVVVQCIGAIGGSAILKVLVPLGKRGRLGVTDVYTGMTAGEGMVMEAFLTFLLIFVIHAVCDGYRKDLKGSGPLAIGLAVTAAHCCGIQYTGSSINPARSFGPAVMMNDWNNHWVYWVGPMLGAAVASGIYGLLFKVKKDESYDL